MYNDFILVGPKADPAGAKSRNIVAGLNAVFPNATMPGA
jgi:ABC-type tungstate transport system permease subunit